MLVYEVIRNDLIDLRISLLCLALFNVCENLFFIHSRHRKRLGLAMLRPQKVFFFINAIEIKVMKGFHN